LECTNKHVAYSDHGIEVNIIKEKVKEEGKKRARRGQDGGGREEER